MLWLMWGVRALALSRTGLLVDEEKQPLFLFSPSWDRSESWLGG